MYSVQELARDPAKQQAPRYLLWTPCYEEQEEKKKKKNPFCEQPAFTQETIYQHICVYPEKVGPTDLLASIVGCSI